jgi:hypothetical protein
MHTCNHVLSTEARTSDTPETIQSDRLSSSDAIKPLHPNPNFMRLASRKGVWLALPLAFSLIAVLAVTLSVTEQRPLGRPLTPVSRSTTPPEYSPAPAQLPQPTATTSVPAPAVKPGKSGKKASKDATDGATVTVFADPNQLPVNFGHDINSKLLWFAPSVGSRLVDQFSYMENRKLEPNDYREPFQLLASLQVILISMALIAAMLAKAIAWLELRPTNEIVALVTDYFEGLGQT